MRTLRAPADPLEHALRVASYNIHKGVLGVGPARRLSIHELQEGLRRLEADLVFLQEVQFQHHAHALRFRHWPGQPQHEVLGRALGLHAAYRTNARTRHGEHGNALLSRWPILSIGHADVSDHRFEQRGLLHVRIDHPDGILHCINVHFGLFGGGRRRQLQRLLQFVAAEVPPAECLIVAGDFNDWRRRAHDLLWREVQLREVFVTAYGESARTFPARFPILSLDRIYVRNASVHLPVVLPRRPWSHLSDHAPLAAEIHL